MEAKARPAGAITVENAYAAIGKAGLPVTDQKQHLAAPFGARYCVGAKLTDAKNAPRLDASVCEYISDEAARIGRDRSADQLKGIPNRTVTQNKQSTLTIRRYDKEAETDALAQKAIDAFMKL
jgi:hypothetical protein